MSTALAPEPCPWCAGLHHGRICGLVKAMEFAPDGSVRRVEFHPPQMPSGAGIATEAHRMISILDGPAGAHGSGRA